MSKICLMLAIRGACLIAMLGASAPVIGATRNVPSQYSTIQAAYDACSSGDTVVVANGTYTNANESNLLEMLNSGTATAPITVEAANVGGAILDGLNQQSADQYYQVVYINGSNNVVRGFQIRNGYYGGVGVWGSYNIVLQNTIYSNGCVDTGNSNGQFGIYDDQTTAYNSYIGNYVHDNGRISLASTLDHGLYLCGTCNEVVANNLIVGNCEFGIQVAGYNSITNMEIYNNTIVSNRNGSGIMLWQTMKGVDIANNIIYGNADYGIKTSACTGSGVQIRNNLFYDNLTGTWIMTANGSTVSYTMSGNITNSDPVFVNGVSDWHLQKCSPTIDAGLTLTPVTTDYDALPRPIPLGGSYDIGAYER